MKAALSKTPTEARKYTYFSNFKDSKRVRWAEYRSYIR